MDTQFTCAYTVCQMFPTIQGEGTRAGTPCILVRFAGCNLKCPWCDTKYTWDAEAIEKEANSGGSSSKLYQLDKLVAEIVKLGKKTNNEVVLLTGGEPGLWPLRSLIDELHDNNMSVAIETNGTQNSVASSRADWVTVSPKLSVPGGTMVDAGVLRACSELKFVIGSAKELAVVKSWLEENKRYIASYIPRLLQPMSTRPAATRVCVKEVIRGGVFRLSIQMHKYIGVD